MFLLVAFPIHEFAHAFAAFQLGDGTARLMGRLTLDPRAHFDPTGALLLAVSLLAFGGGIGWAKPTPVQPDEPPRRALGRGDRVGRRARSRTSSSRSPPRSRCATCIATGMVVPLLAGVLFIFIQINLLLMVFNLIPIPPLDGSKVLYAFLDPRTAWQVRAILEQYGLFILLGAMFLPIFGGKTLIGVVFGEVFDPLILLVVGRLSARMRPGSAAWWVTKVRQTKRHLARARAGTGARRRRGLAEHRRSWPSSTRCTSPTGATGSTSSPRCAPPGSAIPRCCSPGLLHDAGKGDAGMIPPHRPRARPGAAWAGSATRRRLVPGMPATLDRLRDHAEPSARTRRGGGLLAADRRAHPLAGRSARPRGGGATPSRGRGELT